MAYGTQRCNVFIMNYPTVLTRLLVGPRFETNPFRNIFPSWTTGIEPATSLLVVRHPDHLAKVRKTSIRTELKILFHPVNSKVIGFNMMKWMDLTQGGYYWRVRVNETNLISGFIRQSYNSSQDSHGDY